LADYQTVIIIQQPFYVGAFTLSVGRQKVHQLKF